MEQRELDDALANQRLLVEGLMLRVAMLEKILFADELSEGQKEVIRDDAEYNANVMYITSK